jgi:hypothetical protein
VPICGSIFFQPPISTKEHETKTGGEEKMFCGDRAALPDLQMFFMSLFMLYFE